jgi:hypothetical protein
VEVLAEIIKNEVLLLFVPGNATVKWALLTLFTASVGGLLRHHSRERAHRHSEFHLGERIWEFMLQRGSNSWEQCITGALPLFYDIFSRFGISHVSIALPHSDELRIRPEHVYPRESDASYYLTLPKDSVAGLVFADAKARYLPRLFYPINGQHRWPLMIFFPHALVFEIRTTEENRVDIVLPELNVDAFKTENANHFAFKSFISVPLKPFGFPRSFGVMNLDFLSTDPFDRIHVKMAVFLAVMLADEMKRILEST